MKKFEYPNKLNIIFDKLNNYHIKPIIVGGFVRDFFLGIDSKDIDIELYGVDSLQKVEKILQEFGKVNSVGKSFGVSKLLYEDLDLDFSLPRSDSKTAAGHKGFTVLVNPHLDFKSAAKRRDFTMNTIAYDVLHQNILDPYNGIDDLNNKLLQAVDLEKFGEDPLRVLRAVTFAARFNLTIEKNLFALCKDLIEKDVLKELPKERIFQEIKKILLLVAKPSQAFVLLQKLSGFKFFTEFSSLDENVFSSLLASLDCAKIYSEQTECQNRVPLLVAVLCCNFSHVERLSFLNRLTSDKTLTQNVLTLTNLSFDLQNITNYTVYKLAKEVNIKLYLLYLYALYPQKKSAVMELEQRAKKLTVLEKKLKPLLQGRDLIKTGLKPSKAFAFLLNEIYELQMKEELRTKEEALKWLERRVILS